jgi:hypothetical protein
MRPFIVTATQARKLPRWGLLLLCVLYVLPGLIGRDPWRIADASGFGVAFSMYAGQWQDWLMPNIAGASRFAEGPLPYALSALLAHAADWINPLLAMIDPAINVSPHLAVRTAAALGLALMLYLVWHATYLLTRRPGLMPADPLGAGANATDFARALSDSALLIVLAIFGLITRMHETTAVAAQVTWVAAFIFGVARTLELPSRGAIIAGLAIGATCVTGGIAMSIAMLICWLALPLLSQPFQLVAMQSLRIGVPVALVSALLWPVALLITGSDVATVHLANWWQWNLDSVGIPSGASFKFALRYMPWFFWPAWPLAIWALIRWRGSFDQPAVALPLLLSLCFLVLALLASKPAESWLLPATLPIALLASVGLPTLKRGVVNLIDWFAVMFFSLFGFVIWAYWLAFLLEWPPRMAFSVARLVPGFLPSWRPIDLALALLASTAWVLLVQWRISRRPSVIWRAVVLSAGGLCLAWFLLMTLWLPVFNERNTYRHVAADLANEVPGGQCVQSRALGMAERASIAYFAKFNLDDDNAQCPYLLIQDTGLAARLAAPAEPGWTFLWEGGRRRANRSDRFRLYERN